MNRAASRSNQAGNGPTFWAFLAFVIGGRVLFLYKNGMPDPDSVMIAAGVAFGVTGDVPLSETFLYGRQLNPGVYLLMRGLAALGWNDPTATISILNWSTAILGALTVWPLYTLLRSRTTHSVALAAAAIWASSALIWESHTYFHPVVPAVFLLLVTFVCALRVDNTLRGWCFYFLATASGAAALLIRVDVAFALPAVLAYVALSTRRTRNLLLLVLSIAISVFVYIVVGVETSVPQAVQKKGLAEYLARFGQMYAHGMALAGLPRSIAWMVMTIGSATFIAVGAGLVSWFRSGERKYKRDILIAILLILPTVVFWLPYTVPIMRHYYVAALGFAWLLACVLPVTESPARISAATLAIIILNLSIPEVAYRVYNGIASTPKTPHGSFFYYHSEMVQDVRAIVNLRQSVVQSTRSSGSEQPCAVVAGRWNVFTNTLYEAIAFGGNVKPLITRELAIEVREIRCSTSHLELRLLNYGYIGDDAAWNVIHPPIEAGLASGCSVFLPRQFYDRATGVGASGTIVVYDSTP